MPGWIAHVKKYAADHNISYKEALSKASASYTGSKAKKPTAKKKLAPKKPKSVSGTKKSGVVGEDLLQSKKGAGLLDTVKNIAGLVKEGVSGLKDKIFFPPNKLPGGSQKVFNKYAAEKIKGITVYREPINSMVNKAINMLSLGAFDKAKKSLGYDDMFHLFMVVYTYKGAVRIEKNERITLTDLGAKDISGKESVNIDNVPANLTLDMFFENARKAVGDHKFFQYNAFENNCQDFLMMLLENSMSVNPDVKTFIKQDAEALLKQQPGYLSSIAQFATDTAGKISQVVSGQGKRRAKRKQKIRG